MKRIQDKKASFTGFEVSVIGMAGKFPGADNIEKFWDNLKKGVESIDFLTGHELEEADVEAGFLRDPNYIKAVSRFDDVYRFDASFFGYTPREAIIMDPQVRLLFECTWAALEDAGCDPVSYNGRIGLYVGAASNLRWEIQSIISGGEGLSDGFAQTLLRDKDFISTLISYKLNLKGPSLTLNTACSTSLVAIHLACRGLLSGECKMALAGGITISVARREGYMFQENMMVSPDGHCRAFDARAAGTIAGDGVGMVVLKRLKNAVADGDNIYAVIKGSAINNDGSRKMGYTAPSIEGQMEVIRGAMRMAQVEPESITYVETHGTATSLGDPIEIEALKMAFNTDRKQYCSVGSVKSNVGHLDYAAGVTGFIKAVLALKHRTLPPSLHFETPNPKIDFENSPFYVNTELKEWRHDTYPLRAGVSSFGIGGTNVHVVMEETPTQKKSSASRAWQMICLSAKSPSALDKASQNLAKYLKNNSHLSLADVAYTLKVGRRAFKHRKILVCTDCYEAVNVLSDNDSRRVKTFTCQEENKPIVFIFSGLGSQYVNMGLELYRQETIFREEMDFCLDILMDYGYDIKDILYPGEKNDRSQKAVKNSQGNTLHLSVDRIQSIDISQLVIFIFEYALAKMLMKWGLKPQAMIGYSFGEYTASCLSHVLSLENALKLIVFRGKLLKKLSPGAMLSVPLSKGELKPFLNNQVSIAIDNGLSCIVAGSTEAIEAFEKLLKEKKYLCMRLQVSRAMHSKMMEPILGEFGNILKEITLNEVHIPYISNVTGNWIKKEEASDPGYWVKHLRETVRFAKGINQLKKETNSIFIVIGPGRDLSALLTRYIDKCSQQKVINLVRPQEQEISDVHYLLNKIAQLWLYGIKIDWLAFYSSEKRFRIPLPTYPFEGQSYRIDNDQLNMNTKKFFQQSFGVEKPDISNWFYIPSWKKTTPPALLNQGNSINSRKNWLIFVDDHGIGKKIGKRYQECDHDVAYVLKKKFFSCINDSVYTINPQQPDHYDKLVKQLKLKNKKPTMIVHCWSLTPDADNKSEIEIFNNFQDYGFYSLLFLIQALDKHELAFIDHEDMIEFLQVIVITNGIKSVTGKEKIYPEKSTILGLCKTIPLEYRNIKCRSIDIVINEAEPWKDKQLVDQIIDELPYENSDNDSLIAYRENSRWVNYFEPITLVHNNGRPRNLKERGVYLITGGLGRDSLIRAKYLAQTIKARLILIGRSKFPARENWDRWLEDHPQEDQTGKKIEKLMELEALGAEILVISADVGNEKDMKTVINQIDKRFKRLDGVIHAAGITDIESSVLIPNLGRAETELHFKSKVYGLYILEKLLRGRPLDFCMLTSSIASFTGGAGLSAYTAASIFMDTFANKYNRKESVNWMSLNWMGAAPEETTEAFHLLLNQGPIPQIGVSMVDLPRIIKERSKTRSKQKEVDTGQRKLSEKYKSPHLMNAYIAPQNEIERKLGQIWENLFGIETLGIHDDFFELGGDSLKAITVIARIHRTLNVEITLAEFFKHPTIEKLSGYIKGIFKHEYLSIQPVEKMEYYALSSMQRRLYILRQLEADNISYNLLVVSILEGDLNRQKIEEVFTGLIYRHASIRTSFEMVGTEPFQRVHKEVAFNIEYYDVVTDEDNYKLDSFGGNEVQSIVHESQFVKSTIKNFIRTFDLSLAPLLRVGLIKVEPQKHILMVDMHHIISDGVSHSIIIQDIARLYMGEELTPLRLQYKDFSRWQNKILNSKKINEQERYWLDRFKGEIPVLKIPTDYPRKPLQSFEGENLVFEIHEQLTKEFKAMMTKYGTTLYMTLFAVFSILLSKYTNQADIIIGSPIAGRRHADLDNVVGMFVNILLMRSFPAPAKTFVEFLQEVKTITLEAFENQDYQFDDLVEHLKLERDTEKNPLYNVIFAVMNMEEPKIRLPGLNIEPYVREKMTAKTELRLGAMETTNTISMKFTYVTTLFKRESLEDMARHYIEIIKQVVKNNEMKLKDINISHDLVTLKPIALRKDESEFIF
jgi:polyketide synthase PksJ